MAPVVYVLGQTGQLSLRQVMFISFGYRCLYFNSMFPYANYLMLLLSLMKRNTLVQTKVSHIRSTMSILNIIVSNYHV